MSFNEQAFEQKLTTLKETQEAIQAMSQWCLENKEHHKKIVSCWLHCLKRVKVEVRLSLFYLANDVIQYSKRKHLEFVDSWATALQKATPLVRHDKVRHKIQRIFKIWEEREIYDDAFISDLNGLLTTAVKKKSIEVDHLADGSDFQPNVLVRKIKEVKVLGDNTDIKFKRIKENKLPLTDADTMRTSLKDRRHGSDVAAEVDNGVKKMEAFVRALESEISAREKLLELLRSATLFYETQRGEAKIVANAYRNFGNRLKAKQKAIVDVIASMSSPVPSPDFNAPSPSPDSDLDGAAARSEQNQSISDPQFNLVNSSFIGSADFLGLSREVFSSDGSSQAVQNSEAQPIEVIGTREATFDVAEFFKSLMPTKADQALQPPPVPPMCPPPGPFTEWSASGLWDQPPPDPQQSPTQHDKQNVSHLRMGPEVNLGHVSQLPGLGVNMAVPPPPVMSDVDLRLSVPPPSIRIRADLDHQPAMTMPNMDVPPPGISERGALIPPPNSMVGPPPPPPAVQALLDVSQRNLISLTGSPRTGADETGYVPSNPPFSNEQSFHRSQENYEREDNLRQSQETYRMAGWNRVSDDRPQAHEPVKDIVEAVDMDCSDDDEESQKKGTDSDQNYPGPHHAVTQTLNHANQYRPSLLRPAYLNPPPPPGESVHKTPLLSDPYSRQSVGAKLIPAEEPEENGDFNDWDETVYEGNYQEEFQENYEEEYKEEEYYESMPPPRPRWRAPTRGFRPHFPLRARVGQPFRARPRFFRPRNPW